MSKANPKKPNPEKPNPKKRNHGKPGHKQSDYDKLDENPAKWTKHEWKTYLIKHKTEVDTAKKEVPYRYRRKFAVVESLFRRTRTAHRQDADAEYAKLEAMSERLKAISRYVSGPEQSWSQDKVSCGIQITEFEDSWNSTYPSNLIPKHVPKYSATAIPHHPHQDTMQGEQSTSSVHGKTKQPERSNSPDHRQTKQLEQSKSMQPGNKRTSSPPKSTKQQNPEQDDSIDEIPRESLKQEEKWRRDIANEG